jgi:DnaJ-class molecular chaperone
MSYVSCKYCRGKGTVVQGGYGRSRTCPLCEGKGQASSGKSKSKDKAGEARSRMGVLAAMAALVGGLGLWYLAG